MSHARFVGLGRKMFRPYYHAPFHTSKSPVGTGFIPVQKRKYSIKFMGGLYGLKYFARTGDKN